MLIIIFSNSRPSKYYWSTLSPNNSIYDENRFILRASRKTTPRYSNTECWKCKTYVHLYNLLYCIDQCKQSLVFHVYTCLEQWPGNQAHYNSSKNIRHMLYKMKVTKQNLMQSWMLTDNNCIYVLLQHNIIK